MTEKIERRLAAILSADVVGFSRLMQDDEAGTLTRLKSLRKRIVEPRIAEHGGRLVKLMGDGALVEFPSVVDAVQCAVEIQAAMLASNADTTDAQRIEFRIGINVGDIIVEGDDIYGDGVNIAARIEAFGTPGGVCISGKVHDEVHTKVDLVFVDMGAQSLKNIAQPVRIYSVGGSAAGGSKARPGSAIKEERSPSLPSKPSIAVLPLDNMSSDPDQEFFADGLTEDIITELSRFRDLLVISRNSAFVYKGKEVNIQDVAKELDVQYVVEGSVRKAGNRVRVTVQLIDADSDRHIWAEKYDRDIEDIFVVQDEITSSIVSILPGRIQAAVQRTAERKLPESMAAYECVLEGKLRHHRSSEQDNQAAQKLLDRAIALDPKFGHAHAWKACVLGQAWVHGWCEDRDAVWEKATAALQTALSLDDNDSDVHRILSAVSITRNEHEKATYHQERALSLNPNDDLIVVQQGELLTWQGKSDEGVAWIQKAMRLNPFHPERFWNHLGRAYFVARRYDDAIAAFRRPSAPDSTHEAFLAGCFAQIEDAENASSHARSVLAREPAFSVESHLETLHYQYDRDRDHHRESLLKAGLPT